MQEFILTLVVFFILFKVFGRSVTVYNFNGQQQQPKQEPQRKPEGKISIDKQPSASKKKNKDDDKGEYIDYVEIK